jgi:predicted PurR-regulated permease PerM
MTLRTQVLIWVGFTVVVIAAIWLFRPILLPFVVGIALAYILNPLVNIVQRTRIGRGWATAVVLLAVLAAIVGIFVIITPLIAAQIAGLVVRLPGYITDLNDLVRRIAPQLTEWLGPERAAQLEASLAQFLGTGVEFRHFVLFDLPNENRRHQASQRNDGVASQERQVQDHGPGAGFVFG